MSSTLRKMFVMMTMLLMMTGSTSYAAEEAQQTEAQEELSFTEKVKKGAARAGEVAGEFWDNTKAGFGKVTDKFKDWRRSQEEEFWERTEEQLNNEDAADNSANGSSEPEASETLTESGADGDNEGADETATGPQGPQETQETSEPIEESSVEEPETATEPEAGAEAETAKAKAKNEKVKNEPKPDQRKSWPLPAIALCMIGIGGAGALIYERWERWYKTPS